MALRQTEHKTDDPVGRCAEEFRRLVGSEPRWLVSAPGRVNVIGEHIDYLDGYVLPMAINRATYIAAAPLPGKKAVVTSSAQPDVLSINLSDPMTSCEDHWGKYICGVISQFAKASAATVNGFRAHIHSDIPMGGGLSSSAALEVATATLLEVIADIHLDPIQKARLCLRAEHEQVGVPCGVMDQMIAVLGKQGTLLLLDCATLEVRHIPFADSDCSILVVDTGISHDLKESAYALRREQSEEALRAIGYQSYRDLSLNDLYEAKDKLDPTHYRRALHVVTEIQRTLHAASLFERSEWGEAGRLLYESHRSLSEDYEVSCEELDFVVSTLHDFKPEMGVYGARMTGGGFGGCAIALIKSKAYEEVKTSLVVAYRETFGNNPSCFLTRPCEGAKVEIC